MSEPTLTDEQLQDIARAYHEEHRRRFGGDGGRADVPFEQLPDDLVEANLASAHAVLDHVRRMGCGVRPSANPRVTTIPAAVLDDAARAEHRRWVEHQRRHDGTHPDLVPWEDLDERTREKDRVRVQAIPRRLAEVGLELVPPADW